MLNTQDLIVELACSVDSNGELKQYHIVSGSTFTDCFNETLDSASIIIDQVSVKDRLFNIKPYDYVRIFDKTTLKEDGTYSFDRLYLVDTYVEKEINIDEHIFQYTITLMSETKMLEKIQCPNLTVTHTLGKSSGVVKKTIFEVMCQYMELYSPKAKMIDQKGGNWRYDYVLKFPMSELILDQKNGNILINKSNNTILLQKQLYRNNPFYAISMDNERVYNNSDCKITFPAGFSFAYSDYSGTHNATLSETTTLLPGESTLAFKNSYTSSTENVLVGLGSSQTISYEIIDPLYKKFNTSCADLSFSCPTLRQLLTELMLQLGCIPLIKNRRLSYLDFNEEPTEFGINGDYSCNHTVNNIQKSLSSDSYVNTLNNISSGVLDSENKVVCETLGFRDRNSFTLKQTENLNLETRFPIFKVNKMIMSSYVHYEAQQFTFKNINNTSKFGQLADFKNYYHFPWLVGGNPYVLRFEVNPNTASSNVVEAIENIKTEITSEKNGNSVTLSVCTALMNATFYGNVIACVYSPIEKRFVEVERKSIEIECSGDGTGHNGGVYHEGTVDFSKPFTHWYFEGFYFGTIITSSNNRYIMTEEEAFPIDENNSFFNPYPLQGGTFLFSYDITPLIKEQSERSMLEVDFTKLNRNMSIEDLSKFVYGTVGYNIGSKTISGFSNTYSEKLESILGPIDVSKTYIENIWDIVATKEQALIDNISNYFAGKIRRTHDTYECTDIIYKVIGDPITDYNFTQITVKPAIWDENNSTANNFTKLFFDIEYQPLNSFNLTFSKRNEDIPFSLSQYNGNASGRSDFDRLSLNNQDTINRVGRPTLNIAQRTTDYNDIQPLNSLFKDDLNRDGDYDDENEYKNYTIFQRTISINNYSYNVSYSASEDAVLKNFFTSIRTKYRAYEYVDYANSIIRKENDTIFVRIGEDYYRGDDKIIFGRLTTDGITSYEYQANQLQNLISGVSKSEKIGIHYVCEKGLGVTNNIEQTKEIQTVKNDVSLIANDNTFGLIYENPDNIGAGTYLASPFNTTYISAAKSSDGESSEIVTKKVKVGGIPQKWQVWDESYNEKHTVIYAYQIQWWQRPVSVSDQTIKDGLEIVAMQPLVTSEIFDETSDGYVAFAIVDCNTTTNFTKTFYKDYSEIINHTVQFDYYTTDPTIKWGETFIRGNSFFASGKEPNMVIKSNNFEIKRYDEYPIENNDIVSESEYIQRYISLDTSGDCPCIKVNWSRVENGINIIKLVNCSIEGTNISYVTDIIAFKRPTNDYNDVKRYYISLNDTKTDYVMSDKNGVLVKTHKVKSNDFDRKVTNLYKND